MSPSLPMGGNGNWWYFRGRRPWRPKKFWHPRADVFNTLVLYICIGPSGPDLRRWEAISGASEVGKQFHVFFRPYPVSGPPKRGRPTRGWRSGRIPDMEGYCISSIHTPDSSTLPHPGAKSPTGERRRKVAPWEGAGIGDVFRMHPPVLSGTRPDGPPRVS